MARNGKEKLPASTTAKTRARNSAFGILDLQVALIDHSFEPIFVWDWERGIIEWNIGCERQYGFKRAEVLGMNSHELLASQHPISLRRFLKRLESDGYWIGEVRHTAKDGRELVVESRQQVIVQNRHQAVLEINREITERRSGEGRVALLIIIEELIRKFTDPEELLFAASKAVGEYLKVRRCFFNEIDLEKDLEVIDRDFCRGVESVAGEHRLSAYSPLITSEMVAGRTVVNADSKTDLRTAALFQKIYAPAGERSYVAVPLMRIGQWKASLSVSDDEPREWSKAEVMLVEEVGERVWLAVEKRRNEETLRASRAEQDPLITGTPFMLAHCDKDLRFKYVSQSFATMIGRAAEDVIDMSFSDILGKEGFEKLLPHVEAVLRGEHVEYEGEISLQGAGTRYLRVSFVPEFDAEKGIIGWITSIIDISERKRIEKTLQESEESYRILTASASDAIFRINENSVIDFVNAAATRIFGYSYEEMIGQPLTMLMPEEMRSAHSAGFDRYLRTGVRNVNWESVQVPARRKDGHNFPLEISFGEYDRLEKRFFIGIARDISARKKAEGLLERYRLLSERSDDIIWFSRPDGSFVEVNRAAVETYGYTRDEFLNMSVPDLRHPSERGEFRKQLAKAKSSSIRFETLHLCKDGTELPVEVNMTGANFGDERLIMAIVRNITERKNADEALRNSEELFSRFMQHLPGLAWIKDAYGKYIYANSAAERAFRTSREDLYGKTDHEVFPSKVASQFKENDWKVINKETGLQTIETLEHDDRILHHSIVSKFPIFDANGRPGMIGGMAIDITDRVHAEVALRESEERSKLAQEAGNVGIFDWDIISGRTYWSETMWSMYGKTASDVNPGESFWSEHLYDDDRERVRSNISQVLETGDEFRDEFRISMPDGSIRWIEARAAVSRDSSGTATRMYGVNTDTTQRKEVEERIRLSDNQLRLVTNALPALISYVDNNRYYRFANQSFTDLFGVPNEEIIGKKPRDIFGAKAYRVLKPYIDKTLLGERCTFKTVLNYKGLGDKFVHISYIPDVGANGAVYGYYGLTHDLTDLKHSEDLLRSSEERVGLIMESLEDYAIFSLDNEGLINSWNKGAESIFGYLQKEIIGRSHEILYTADDVANAVPQNEMVTACGKSRASDERWLIRKDGGRFYAHGVMMPLHVGKAITGYAKIVSDLTEKKRHAEELQRAHDELEVRVKDRTKELAESNAALVQEMEDREIAETQRVDLLRRLVSSQEYERRRIARDLHDQLGQRLTALRLKIASLHEISPDSEQFTPRVHRLQEIAESLDSEVSFLAWELRPTTLDDLGLLDAVAAFVNQWSRHCEIPAEFHSAGLPKERLDREIETHLYRITQEALNNILKHAEAKHVTVMLEGREQSVILIIEDDGKGFDTSKKRVSNVTGKGLGLVGMSERATLIGGELEIESASGKGTTIYVRVPVSN